MSAEFDAVRDEVDKVATKISEAIAKIDAQIGATVRQIEARQATLDTYKEERRILKGLLAQR